MVNPRSRSSLSLSRTHAYLNEPFPSASASVSKSLSVFSGIAGLAVVYVSYDDKVDVWFVSFTHRFSYSFTLW